MFVPAMLLAMFWGERPLAKSQNMQNNQTTKVASTTSGPVPIPYFLGAPATPPLVNQREATTREVPLKGADAEGSVFVLACRPMVIGRRDASRRVAGSGRLATISEVHRRFFVFAGCHFCVSVNHFTPFLGWICYSICRAEADRGA